ncbi:unnamed protein product [Brachionus calyciflorus]|uniref:OTU domain-containing protein n=1 Tax=Brachionus calyciflorus TaxID=104777 RepID=A0A813N2W1_9BILA|nr:unnamed protein product [Brachionus calyciflorus]
MSNLNDERVLNAIINPNTPFEDKKTETQPTQSKYEINQEINDAKNLEVEGVKAAQTGDIKRSIECFSKAIEIAPHWASSYNNRAQALQLSGDVDRDSLETLESLNERHRKEKKDLMAKIMNLKKSVTKGDKKKKKEVDAEIEKLEKEFDTKCSLEIKNFTENQNKLEIKRVEIDDESKPEKLSKAKKKREKKEKNEQDREKAIALQEIENLKGPAAIELNKIKDKLSKKGLRIKEIISDGNCMYYAVSDQIDKLLTEKKNFQNLRDLTCDYMLRNPDEFQPYLTSDDGDFLDSEKYVEYCEKIKNTSVWGGQLELKALSELLDLTIQVIQSEGPEIIIGEDKKSVKPLIITYHRHMLGSGEHYNSTEPDFKKASQDLEKAINLAEKYNDQKVLSLALSQKGTILRLRGRDEEALECFKQASLYGNCFAKQQIVNLNPYAALCNQMLSGVFEKIKQGESYN